MTPEISIFVAIVGVRRAIGKNNDLLYRISEDLKRFKSITLGHPIIMGRKTFDSIGKALPGRTNIVITRDTNYEKEGVIAANSLEEALSKAKEIDQEEIFIIGGGEIYKQALPFTTKLYLTKIDADDKDADIFFPEFESHFTKVVFEEHHPEGNPPYTFLELKK